MDKILSLGLGWRWRYVIYFIPSSFRNDTDHEIVAKARIAPEWWEKQFENEIDEIVVAVWLDKITLRLCCDQLG